MEKNNQEKKTEPNAISELVGNSLERTTPDRPRTIEQKQQAAGHLHLIEGSRPQQLIIYNHLHSIGADNHVLVGGNKKENKLIMQKWFQTLVIKNARFPIDIPITFVLEDFFEAILQKKIELKGFNLLAHMTAFHEYLDGFEHSLKAKYWHSQNPENRPKVLPEIGSTNKDEQELNDEERKKMIKKIYGSNVPESLQKYL